MLDDMYLISDQVKNELKNPAEFVKKLESTSSFQKALGFSDEALLGFYEAAKSLLEQKRYSDAGNAFFFLSQLAPQVKAFWLGMARSEYLNGNTEQAIPLYVAALAFDDGDKEIYLECVRCCLAAQKYEEAIQVLDMALSYTQKHPDEPHSTDLYDTSLECKNWIISHHRGGVQ